MGIDEAAADKPAPLGDPIHDQLTEAKTETGWSVWRREYIKVHE